MNTGIDRCMDFLCDSQSQIFADRYFSTVSLPEILFGFCDLDELRSHSAEFHSTHAAFDSRWGL
jgi:hypothetical protein